MAIELTDEMRQAVLDEICAELGHIVDIAHLFSTDPNQSHHRLPEPIGPEGKLPYVDCQRCKRVLGVFIATESRTYAEAEQAVGSMLRDRTQLEKRRGPRRKERSRRHDDLIAANTVAADDLIDPQPPEASS